MQRKSLAVKHSDPRRVGRGAFVRLKVARPPRRMLKANFKSRERHARTPPICGSALRGSIECGSRSDSTTWWSGFQSNTACQNPDRLSLMQQQERCSRVPAPNILIILLIRVRELVQRSRQPVIDSVCRHFQFVSRSDDFSRHPFVTLMEVCFA